MNEEKIGFNEAIKSLEKLNKKDQAKIDKLLERIKIRTKSIEDIWAILEKD